MKIVKVVILICCIITIGSVLFPDILTGLVSIFPQNVLGEAHSIGIIGGADGPTAILITQGDTAPYIPLFFGALSVLGTVFILLKGRVEKKNKNGDEKNENH